MRRDITSVVTFQPYRSKDFPKEFLCEAAVLQRCPVIHIARCKLPLYDLSLVIDDQM